MSMPGIGNPVRSSLKDNSIWHTEWTFAAADTVTTIDNTVSDRDERVPTPVVKNTTGIVNLTFPKCARARLIGKNLSPGTPGTGANHRDVAVCDINAAAGTATVRFISLNGTPAATDPSAASRCSVTLLLECI